MTILLPCFGGEVMAQSSFTPGPLQANLLAQAGDAEAPDDRPTLQTGSSGPLVIELQVRLKKLGLFEAEIDGDFDAETLAAVEAFQKDHGLPVDGIVAGMTWKALDSPAAAKISAAIAAATPEESGENSEEGEPEQEENADASNPASEKTSLLASPQSRLALLALSIVGIGVGGFGIGKVVIASKTKRNRKRGRSTKVSAIHTSSTQSSTTPIAPSLALPSAPGTSPEEFSSDDDDGVWASDNPLSTSHSRSHGTSSGPSPRQPLVAHQDETRASAKILPLKSGSKAMKDHPNAALSSAASSALAPSASHGAIEHRRETTELSPTPRLARLDIVQARIGELQSSNPTHRRKAIWELGQRADSRAIQPLVNLMATSDSKQRSLILAALSEIGTQTLKPMKRALAMSLQDANAEVRKNAIRDLTRIYDLVAQISNLLAIATEDQDPEVRETARWALGQLNRIRANAGLDEAPTQQLLNKSVSPPETVSEEPSLRDQSVSRAADLA